ncbi:MAG: hypothetical protein GYA39_08655 [Methanothrix sp.]|nr:hypothetical protein [Methanothrix sp.]
MRRLIPILFILSAIIILVHGKSSFQLGGDDGISLLKDLANNSTISVEVNKTMINLTHSVVTVQLSGNEATGLLKNLTNGSLNGANNTTGNLSTWGSKPRTPPAPPAYDERAAQTYAVLRQNHLGAL